MKKVIKKFAKILEIKKWKSAQEAEKNCWIDLWKDMKSANSLAESEIIKHTFLIKSFEKHFKTNFSKLFRNKIILDVGCGPVSYVARLKSPIIKEGVDPLKYPEWVYNNYREEGFTVFLVPFEDYYSSRLYDYVLFYNALQHFRNIDEVAEKARKLVNNKGKLILIEYLNVPTDSAHIHLLTKDMLDRSFRSVGFKVKSKVIKTRLPGYVEMGNGMPAEVYMAIINL